MAGAPKTGRGKAPKHEKYGVRSPRPLLKRLERVRKQRGLTSRSQAINEAIERYVVAHERAAA